MTTFVGLLALVVLGWVQRRFFARRLERRFAERFPEWRDGIVVGAESRTYHVPGTRAILLLHGYNDSPSSVDGVARHLHAAGWTVRVPLMPGHGRALDAFDRWTATDVLREVRGEFAALRARYSTVVVGGLSMGGALSCWLAAEADVDGVLLFAPMLFVPRPMQVAVSTARLWTIFTKYIGGGSGRSVKDDDARRRLIAYGYSTRRSLEALEEIAEGTIVRLGFVRAPMIIQQSAGTTACRTTRASGRLRAWGARTGRCIGWRARGTCSRWTTAGRSRRRARRRGSRRGSGVPARPRRPGPPSRLHAYRWSSVERGDG